MKIGLFLAGIVWIAAGEMGQAQGLCTGDVNGDLRVGAEDLSRVIAIYGTVCSGCPEDVFPDGVISAMDIATVVGYYGWQCQEDDGISGFTLIDAQTDRDLFELEDQQTVFLGQTGDQLNIRADPYGQVGSVKFFLNGEEVATESAAPFAMAGDVNGDYSSWTPSPGDYTLLAIPYSGSGGTGEAGNSLEVSFSVVLDDVPLEYPEDEGTGEFTLTGELKKWHRVTLSFHGPFARELDNTPNPFMDYRFQVTFSNGAHTYVVPGFFAADGDAAESGATSGNIWRVHFAPDLTGTWNWQASFVIGNNAALYPGSSSETPIASVDGKSGTFQVGPTDKTGRDNRALGRLDYVGEHYLRYGETGEYFLKGGADSPENFLAYSDFDGDFKTDGYRDFYIKDWSFHTGDWNPGDPVWQGSKGKGMIGAINYLASEGLNAFSFLTMNIEADGRNVFPYVSYTDYSHFDCSRLDQWEIIFSHADSKGMHLHFKTQETENDQLLDGGEVGPLRRAYYRELIARFSHHLALNWNLGEENSQTTAQQRDMARYFHENDPYRHPVVIHTTSVEYDAIYGPLLGDQSELTGASIQTGYTEVRRVTEDWVNRSAASGKKWVVANDEQNPTTTGVPEDGYTGTPDAHDIRKKVLWGNLMAGGGGVEYYFGNDWTHSDIRCEDFRSRDQTWDYVRYALGFFRENVDFWRMEASNELVTRGWCLAEPGQQYLVYLEEGGSSTLQLSSEAAFQVRWFDPRNGGALQTGTVTSVQGPGTVSLGEPPSFPGSDWAVLIY